MYTGYCCDVAFFGTYPAVPHQLPTWGAEPRSHLPWRPAWKPSKAAQLRSHIDSSNKSRPNETNANSATLSPSPIPGQRLPSGEPSSRTLPRISVSIKPTVSLRASPYLIKKGSDGFELRFGPGPSRATAPPPWRPSFVTYSKYRGHFALPPHRYAGLDFRLLRIPHHSPCGGRARRSPPPKMTMKKRKKRKEGKE